MVNYEAILSVYTLEEILEINEITEDEALQFLVERQFVTLPKVLPIDYDTP